MVLDIFIKSLKLSQRFEPSTYETWGLNHQWCMTILMYQFDLLNLLHKA